MVEFVKPLENVPLAPFTTLKIGGPARYFFRVQHNTELIRALEFARDKDTNVFILGGGSNLLVSDNGFDGVVINVATRGTELAEQPDGVLVTVAAGEDWDAFVKFCVRHDLAGIECLSGIPGTVGGTPVQNVGAYGQEVSDVIIAVKCYDRVKHRIVDLTSEECGFTYRTSIFNSKEAGRFVVLAVSYLLTRNGKSKLTYKDLVDRFDGRSPSLSDVRETVLNIRRTKSMVIDPNDPNSRSVGSFFKNPIVDRSVLDELKKELENVPFFEFGEMVKIPAAWLIEKAGFEKGYSFGNAGISANHTLALVNRGGATAAEVLGLMERIQRGVERRFGITLRPEPVFVGFDTQATSNEV